MALIVKCHFAEYLLFGLSRFCKPCPCCKDINLALNCKSYVIEVIRTTKLIFSTHYQNIAVKQI